MYFVFCWKRPETISEMLPALTGTKFSVATAAPLWKVCVQLKTCGQFVKWRETLGQAHRQAQDRP